MSGAKVDHASLVDRLATYPVRNGWALPTSSEALRDVTAMVRDRAPTNAARSQVTELGSGRAV